MSHRKSQSLEVIKPPLLGLIMLRAESQGLSFPAHPSPTTRHLLTPVPGLTLILSHLHVLCVGSSDVHSDFSLQGSPPNTTCFRSHLGSFTLSLDASSEASF